ncbi:MAG: hypothetical protein ACI80V_001016 [Rhodothermales bacterium]|jgi:uncharacterized protein (TIGR02453 family)
MSQIQPASLEFLTDLGQNNNREWFAANKGRYDAANADAKAFMEALAGRMNQLDIIQQSRLFRIYRDVRFAKDAAPYHARLGISLSRQKPHLRGGYMVRFTAEQTTIGAGFWGPNSADLATIRSNIDDDPERFREACHASQIQDLFGDMKGSAVKTAPKGYRQDHPHIDQLRYKQFIYNRTISPQDTTSADFLDEVVFSFQAVRPFFNYMSEILTGA